MNYTNLHCPTVDQKNCWHIIISWMIICLISLAPNVEWLGHIIVYCTDKLVQEETCKSATTSFSNYKMFELCPKPNFLKFDQVYTKKYQHLQHHISFIKSTMKYSFIMYLFDIVDIGVYFYKFGQTERNFT